jgi:hypothetical protein
MAIGKGKKRLKNVPVLHEGLKKKRTIWLTDDAWVLIEELALSEKISKSECLEQLILNAAKAARVAYISALK